MRAATLYLLLENPALIRATSDFAQGNVTASQLNDAVIEAMRFATKRFGASGQHITALLEKHALSAAPRN